MLTVYLVSIHVCVLACLALVTWLAFAQIVASSPGVTRYLRAIAMAGGFLVFLGAKAATMNVPDLLTAALEVINPIRFPLLDAIIPMAAGALAAWFLTYSVERDASQERLVYILLMLSTFLLVMFADVYAASWLEEKDAGFNQQLQANLVFVLGIILYVLFFRKTKTLAEVASKPSWRDKV